MPASSIYDYLNELRRIAGGQATEHTYRPELKKLINLLANHLNRPVADIIIEPGNITGVGAPDIHVYGPTSTDLIGYIETKDLGKNLDNLSGHDLRQFNRYNSAFSVWIFTNFLEFRLIESGRQTMSVILCSKQEAIRTGNLRFIAQQKANELVSLFDHFLQQSVSAVNDARKLASLLANRALMLKDAAYILLTGQQHSSILQAQLRVYRDWLMPDLTEVSFADLFAQTITYGLFFAAYLNSKRNPPLSFNRPNLLGLLPDNTKPVKSLFQLVASGLMPTELTWFMDDIMRLLERVDMKIVTNQLAQGTGDPTVHFYETFLSHYDPALREKRGVYYTPDAVVNYIVGSVDQLLRQHFGKIDGLANIDVTLLDPALGTGTFIVHALRQIASDFGTAQAGDIPDHLRDHTLKRFFGFELLAAPYILAHLKLGYVLEGLGLPNGSFQLYLTNTLSDHQPPSTLPGPFEIAISEDALAALRVKGQEKILVILGNPPYRGESPNAYEKVNDYKFVDGVPLRERNSKWLQNDYVKFIRWSEWKIAESEQSGYKYGIIAFITANSYLNGVIFRGMRWHLLKHFSHIYILNLHGASGFGEVHPPNIQVDQNVFEIQQGTAIAIFVREENYVGDAQVFYADLWGEREVKYNYLTTNNVGTTHWTQLFPRAPYYRFVEQNSSSLIMSYDQWPFITSILPKYRMGIVTGRDPDVYDYEEMSLKTRFSNLLQNGDIDIVQATYRPFDTRWLAYGSATVTRRREDIMRHILRRDNFALVTFRHTRRSTEMRAFVSRHIVDARLLSSESNCFVFPLYLYTNPVFTSSILQTNIIDQPDYVPNFAPKLMAGLLAQYGVTITSEEVFYYLYGILNAPGYQSEFEDSLRNDFPRIPFTTDYDAFKEMSERGKRIVELHLCEANDLQGLANLEIGYRRSGTNLVDRLYPTFDAINGYIHINSSQYFEGISQEMWNYKVGSYNPLKKWLEDRQSHVLSGVERRHYETFATSIKKVLLELPQVEAAWQIIISNNWFNPLI